MYVSSLLCDVKKWKKKKNNLLPSHPFQDKKRVGFWASQTPKKTALSPRDGSRTWPSPHVWLFFTGGWPLLWQIEQKWSIWPCLSLSRKYIPPSVPAFVAAGRVYPSLCFKAMGLILITGAGYIISCTNFLSYSFLSYSIISTPHLLHSARHTRPFFNIPFFFFFCFFLNGHLVSGVASY